MQNPDDLLRARTAELGEPSSTGIESYSVGEQDLLSQELTDDAIAAPTGGDVVSHGGLGRRILSVFVENKLAVVGVGGDHLLRLVLLRRPARVPHEPDQREHRAAHRPYNAPPGNGHPLGTDSSGFDILGRLMYGGQVSLLVGFAAAAVATHLRRALRGDLGLLRHLGRRLHDAGRRRLPVDPGAVPGHRPGDRLPPVAHRLHLRHRLRLVADPRPAHPGAGAVAPRCASTSRPCG